MKNLVVTLDINYPKEITDLTFPYMKKYAKNINADFNIILERKYPQFPIPMEKFQLYDLSMNYEWVIFLDADCLINPKTYNFTALFENDVVIVSQYINNLNCKQPLFQTKNIMGKYNIDIYYPFYFLAFHKSQNNVVKPWCNPLQYKQQVNITQGMKKNNIQQEWHLDEFLLAINIVKYGISTISVKDDLPHTIISHDGNYLTTKQKVHFLKQSVKTLQNMSGVEGKYE